MNVGIYIYERAEVLDFSGPFEVFSTASRLAKPSERFHVFLVSERKETVVARGGFNISANYSFNDHPSIDILLIPGGVHTEEMEKVQVLKWIGEAAESATIVASVCTGAFLLAAAKVLTDQRVTTHWEDIPDLRQRYPALKIIDNVRWLDQGKVVTSAGISAGIDMSLYLVARLRSPLLAEKTARQMEYDWTKRENLQD